MKNQILLLFFFACIHSFATAQTAEINDVKPRKCHGLRPIVGKGYYVIYQVDDAKAHAKVFAVKTYDYDLKEIKSFEITLPKGSEALDGVFNGTHFMLAFTDEKNKSITLLSYDEEGAVAGKKLIADISTINFTEPSFEPKVFAGDENGFFVIYYDKDKKYGYILQKVNNNMKAVWQSRHSPETGYENIADASQQNGQVVLLKLWKEKALSKKYQNSIVVLNDDDGSRLYEYSLFDGTNDFYPTEFAIDADGNLITAGMFFEGEKLAGLNSDGMFFLRLSNSGKEIVRKVQPWNADIDAIVKANTHGQGGIGLLKPKLIFMDIIPKQNGNYIAVAQAYKVTADAFSIANNMLNAHNSEGQVTKVVLDDIFLFEFKPSGDLVNISDINATVAVYLPAYILSSPIQVGLWMKSEHLTNYAYWTASDDGTVSIVYMDYIKGKGSFAALATTAEKGNPTIKKVSLEPRGADESDAAGLDFKSRQKGLVKSKAGYLAFYGLSQKDKKIQIKVVNLADAAK